MLTNIMGTTHHDDLEANCLDCGGNWTKSSDGLSAYMQHTDDCAYMRFMLEQDEGREYIEWMYSEDEDQGAMLFQYDRWLALMQQSREHAGRWCVRCNEDRIVVEEGSNSGFAGEGLSWYTLACDHSEVEEGNILSAIL